MSFSNPHGDSLDYNYPDAFHERQGPSRRDIAISGFVVVVVICAFGYIFQRQGDQARAVNCSNNLRQLGTALMLYAQDNDESFPNRLTGWPATATRWQQQEAYTWRAAISSYLTSKTIKNGSQAYHCLSNPKNEHGTGCMERACGAWQEPDGFAISYACNFVPPQANSSGDARGFCADKNASPVTLRSLQNPTQLIALVEDELAWSEFNVTKSAFHDQLFDGHAGTSNYLFADGHVAPLTPSATLAPINLWVNGSAEFGYAEKDTAGYVLGIHR